MIRFARLCSLVATSLVVLSGCSDRPNPVTLAHSSSASDDQQQQDQGDQDAGQASKADAGSSVVDSGPAPTCSSSFGSALTTEFGRVDGTLVGIARPQDHSCAQPNATHIALDVEINGAAYRFLVNVQSDSGAPEVYFTTAEKKLAGPAWSEGWHTASGESIYLDYPSYLDVHTAGFTTSYPLDELTDKVVSELIIGEKISVYATGYGPDGAHDIHKESAFGDDGAVVVGPDTASPKWLLFRFDDSPAF